MGNIYIIKLAIDFGVIVLCIWKRRPLYQAMLVGILAVSILHPIWPVQGLSLIYKVVSDWNAISLLI